MAGWLGGLDPVKDFNPLLQMASGIHFSLFGSFVFGTPEFPISEVPLQQIVDRVAKGVYKAKPAAVFPFEEIREAQQLMESNRANGKIIVVFRGTDMAGGLQDLLIDLYAELVGLGPLSSNVDVKDFNLANFPLGLGRPGTTQLDDALALTHAAEAVAAQTGQQVVVVGQSLGGGLTASWPTPLVSSGAGASMYAVELPRLNSGIGSTESVSGGGSAPIFWSRKLRSSISFAALAWTSSSRFG